MDNKTEESRTRYNKLADQYEESFDGKFTLQFNQFICDYLKLRDNDSVLDIACGNGRLLRMLSKKARINSYGADVSEEMVTAAQSLYKEASFRVSPADNIDFPDCSFDYVTVCCAFHHFTKPEAFAKEAYRVLKSQGKLVIADPSSVAVIRWIENLIIPYVKTGDVKLYSTKELYKFFEDAGFKNITHVKKNGMVIVEGTKE